MKILTYIECANEDHTTKDRESKQIQYVDPPHLPLLPVCEEALAALTAPVAAVVPLLHTLVRHFTTITTQSHEY